MFLRRLLAFLCCVGLTFFVSLSQPAQAAPSPMLATLPLIGNLFSGQRPDLGLQNGRLAPCPDSPNCVVSYPTDAEHQIAPLAYQGDRVAARETLIKVLGGVPGAEIIEQSPEYVRAEFTSKLMGFVDDGEFYFPSDESVIHVRSASRLGQSDLGVNRRRIEQIRLALQDLGA